MELDVGILIMSKFRISLNSKHLDQPTIIIEPWLYQITRADFQRAIIVVEFEEETEIEYDVVVETSKELMTISADGASDVSIEIIKDNGDRFVI